MTQFRTDYGARVYDPRIARFMTEDPVREYMNPYAYVAWNPVMRTDPTGMELEGLNIAVDLDDSNGPGNNSDGILKRDFAVTLALRGLRGSSGPGGTRAGGSGGNFAGFLHSSSASQATAITVALSEVAGQAINASFQQGVFSAFSAGMGLDVNFSTGALGVSSISAGIVQGFAFTFGDAIAGDAGVALTSILGSTPAGVSAGGLPAGADGAFENALHGGSLLAASAVMAATGAVLLRGGLAGFGHAGSVPLGLATLAVLNDAALMSTQGGVFVFAGGFITGIAINDYLIAPALGTPTYAQLLR